MNAITKVAAVLAVLAILGFLLSGLLFVKIPPAEIGVKQNQLGGLVEKDYGMGYHLGVVGVHKWYRLDGRVHFITFSRESSSERNEVNVNYAGTLDIRTADNNTASLDVTVSYRIKEGSGWQLVQEGLQLAYPDRVQRAVRGLLLEELSKLGPEDFVDTDTRIRRVEETMPMLRDSLAKYHVEPLSILVRAVRFPAEYESKLQLKQLTRQKALLADAKEKQERQQQVTESYEKQTGAFEIRERSLWDVRLQEERSENVVKIAQINADARIYDATTRAQAEANYVKALAEGELSVARAEALRNELRNAALDTVGGRILLARQAAQNLEISEVTLNSNDPSIPSVIDINEMVKLLIGSED